MPRPRKPDNVHVLQGTYRGDRHSKPVIETPGKLPKKPPFLSENAALVWDETIKLLKKTGWLEETDETLLAIYCELAAEWKRDPLNFQTNRLTQLRLIMADLGLTPPGRAKMPTKGKQKPKNSFDL